MYMIKGDSPVSDRNASGSIRNDLLHYLISAMFVVGLTFIAWLLDKLLKLETPTGLNLLFIIPVFYSSVFYRLPVAVFTATISACAYDMVLTPPMWHLEPWKMENIVNWLIMILTVVSVSSIKNIRLLALQNQMLEEGQKRAFLSALLSSITHDFRTPLVTVIGALSALKEMRSYDNIVHCRQLVSGALEEAEKLNRFIGNLLEISRLETGMTDMETEIVSLRDLLASPLKSLRHLITHQNIIITIENGFPLLKVNQTLMELVFLNLLENAIKYSGEEGTVSVTSSYNEQRAIIDIEDDGPGIPEDERKDVFLKFYRSKGGDRKVGGTGLGLYICKGIIEALGGTIVALGSIHQKGGCLRITLPASALMPVHLEEESEAA